MPTFWTVKPEGYNDYLMTRDVTWADIKACVNNLSLNCEAYGGVGDEFAPLHRIEGGFMCVAGVGFKSTEPVDSKLPNQQPVMEDRDKWVRRAIHFDGEMNDRWPSRCDSFLDTPDLHDNTVVLPMGRNGLFSLRFEGQNSEEWTPHQCKEFGSIIADELNLFQIHGNLAAKVRNGQTGGVKRKSVQKECKRRRLNPPKYPPESFNRPLLDLTLPILLCGGSDCGKIQFAKAHFKNPLVCTQNEDVKHFDPDFHDGIVFSNMDFQDWSSCAVKHLLDTEEPGTIGCKFGSYVIPAYTKKIFTSQNERIFQCKKWEELNTEEVKSITRRYVLVSIDQCLFNRAA